MNGASKLIFVIPLAFGYSMGIGGEIAYTCDVKHIYGLSDDGTIRVSGFFEEQMKGSAFSVSRISGEIIGEVIPTVLAKSTRVLNKGSKENSFKAVADFGGQYQILEIQEFKQGSVKPFVAFSMGGAGIVTGTCK